MKKTHSDEANVIKSVVQEYITDKTEALTTLKTQLEKQLKELNENKNTETTSPNALTEQSMKEKLENAIQRELERAHLQKQIDDLKQEIKKKQGNVGPDSTATTETGTESTEYASKYELNKLSDTVVKNQLEQAIKDAFTTQLILQNTQNSKTQLIKEDKAKLEKLEQQKDEINDEIKKLNEQLNGTNDHDYSIQSRIDGWRQALIDIDQYKYDIFNRLYTLPTGRSSVSNDDFSDMYPYEHNIPEFATAEEFQRFKLEHAILHAFESKLKQNTKPPGAPPGGPPGASPGASPVASSVTPTSASSTPTSVSEGDIEFVDGINTGKGKKITININKSRLKVDDIPKDFISALASKLSSKDDASQVQDKINDLVKTEPYKNLENLVDNVTVYKTHNNT